MPFCDDTLTFYTDIFLTCFKLLSYSILVLAHSRRYLTSLLSLHLFLKRLLSAHGCATVWHYFNHKAQTTTNFAVARYLEVNMLKEKSLLRAILSSYLMKSCGTIKDEGSLTSKSESDILAAIKTLEFREETAEQRRNPAVVLDHYLSNTLNYCCVRKSSKFQSH